MPFPSIVIAIHSLLILLLMTSCSNKKALWEISETKTRHTSHQAFRISQKPNNIFRGIEVEFVRTSSGLRTYLNVHTLAFTENRFNHKKTEIVFISGGDEKSFLADRLEGGQRLLLPMEAQEFLLEKLSKNQSVKVISGRFDVDILPEELPSHLAKLRRNIT